MGFWEAEQPDPPDYAAANREGIMADIETLPLRRMIEQAAKLGTKIEYKDPSTGEMRSADFTGMGDVDLSQKLIDFSVSAADKLAAGQLATDQKYGVDFVEQRRKELQAADPEGFAIREQMGKSILDDIMAGKGLDDQMRAEVVEAERGAQAARGNILGQSSGAAEAMEVGNAGFRLWQQKLANAASFINGSTPVAQFSGLTNAQQGASPFNAMSPVAGSNLNPNAGAMGWQAATQSWNMQFQKNAYEQQNNVWNQLFQTGLDMSVAAAGAFSGAAAGR